MRSVMLLAARYCRAASMTASARRVATRRSRQVLRSVRRPAPSGGGGVWLVGRAVGQPAMVMEERLGEVLADRRAQGGVRREHGIGIDIASDLARDVRLAGRRQRKGDKGRFECPVGENRA